MVIFMKILKTTDELIEHLKDKGCKFNIVNEEQAKDFLSKHNYYLKLAAFRNNYDKINSGQNKGKYKNLEFAYLKELSTIDMYLRKIIFKMCSDIEHNIKVMLLKDTENNPDEDGYKCISKFVGEDIKNRLTNIKRHSDSEYCKNLINKYYPYFPIWVYVELISFGTLAHLCDYYNTMYGRNFLGIDNRLLNSVRDLRNASAHNNCLINKLQRGDNKPLQSIVDYVSKNPYIKSESRNKKLSNKFIYDFVTLIYVYNNIIKSDNLRQNQLEELKQLVCGRMRREIEYFNTNCLVKSSFDFLKKIIDNL